MSNTFQQQIGTAYEYYVLEHIKDKFDNVWHWKDFPEKLMYEINLINDYKTYSKYRYDIGADLVAFKDNKYYFIQCKNYNDTILMENLAGFYFLLYEYNLNGILYYNGTLSQRVIDLSNKKIEFINLPFNNQTINYNNSNIDNTYELRQYQIDAISKLENKNMSILSLPCGMGKTYVSAKLAQKYDNIIILSPLRYLAYQNLESFKNILGKLYEPILISLDGKRNINEIKNYIKDKNIISSTYDSTDITYQLIELLKGSIFVIIDEFHNLSDNNINNNDDNLKKIIKSNNNKLFLSATPIINFMNITDENIYKYSWNESIKNKYICDFKIYIPDKKDNYNDFAEIINKTCNTDIEKELIKKAYFILKGMLYNGNKKCIIYMTSIEKAIQIYDIMSWIKNLLNINLKYWQIDCNTKKTIRSKIIKEFRQTSDIGIIINVHILDEGINIVECDSVFITCPSDNIINIIQRMCRANRITEHKKECSIYMWCRESKIDDVLDYLYTNTEGYVKNKIYIYNTNNKNVEKYDMMEKNIVKYDTLNNNIDDDINLLFINNLFLKYDEIKIYIAFEDNINEPWFQANNICKILKYIRPRNAISEHVNEKDRKPLDELVKDYKSLYKNVQGHTVFINETGLYSLIFSSRMEEAKKIREWITHDVLPQIRKYGEYKIEDIH